MLRMPHRTAEQLYCINRLIMTGIIILAAGASTRMGSPKQQLMYQGKTLLQHTIETALSTECSPVIVVLGAHAM